MSAAGYGAWSNGQSLDTVDDPTGQPMRAWWLGQGGGATGPAPVSGPSVLPDTTAPIQGGGASPDLGNGGPVPAGWNQMSPVEQNQWSAANASPEQTDWYNKQQNFTSANPGYADTGYWGNSDQVAAQVAGGAQSASIPQGVLGPETYTRQATPKGSVGPSTLPSSIDPITSTPDTLPQQGKNTSTAPTTDAGPMSSMYSGSLPQNPWDTTPSTTTAPSTSTPNASPKSAYAAWRGASSPNSAFTPFR